MTTNPYIGGELLTHWGPEQCTMWLGTMLGCPLLHIPTGSEVTRIQ